MHIVYKTTNNISNEYYIGKHSTNNLDDGYMGSGVRIIRSIKKYGIDNFKREILHIFETEVEAYQYEMKEIERCVGDKLLLNLTSGGEGYRAIGKHNWFGKNHKPATKIKMSTALVGNTRGKANKNKIHSEDTRIKMSKGQIAFNAKACKDFKVERSNKATLTRARIKQESIENDPIWSKSKEYYSIWKVNRELSVDSLAILFCGRYTFANKIRTLVKCFNDSWNPNIETFLEYAERKIQKLP